MSFGKRLKQLRKDRRITQKKLALEVNMTERFCQELEYDKSRPGYEILVALADYFGVSLDYLVGRSDDPTLRRSGGN